MALPKLVLALGFLFVLGWIQTTTAIRNRKSLVTDGSDAHLGNGDPVESINHQKHFPSTDNPRRPPTVSVPDDSSSEHASEGDTVPSISYRRHFRSTRYPRHRTVSASDDNSAEYASTSDPVPSANFRKDFYSTSGQLDESSDNVQRNGTREQAFTARKPDSSGSDMQYSTETKDTDYPYSSPKSDPARSTASTRRYTTSPEENSAYSSPKPDTAKSTGYTGRYTTPEQDTRYSSSESDTAKSTGYTGRYTTPGQDTRYPSSKQDTAKSTGYTGRYTTPGQDIRYSSSEPDTAKSTGYTGRYTTPGQDTRYSSSEPDTGTSTAYTSRYTGPEDDTRYPTPSDTVEHICNTYPNDIGYICYTRRYTAKGKNTAYPSSQPDTPSTKAFFFTTKTTPFICSTRPNTFRPYDQTPSGYKFETTNTGVYSTNTPSTPIPKSTARWDPTGNCLIFNTDPRSSSWERRTTPITWVPPTDRKIGSTRNTDRTSITSPTPWWWNTTPVTKSTPDSKKITESKPNSGSDLVPGSLKNFFFIACKTCNVFSKIDVKNEKRNTRNSNGEVMFQNMIDNMETKIDGALKNIMST